MRAIVYSEKGPSSVLTLVERSAPEPGPGQVRVRLVRAGVNPTDWKTRAGVSSASMAFPEITPGQDGAGFVDSLGADVPGLAIGDRVWLYLGQRDLPYGTAAEYSVLDARHVVRLPDSLPGDVAFDLGASLGVDQALLDAAAEEVNEAVAAGMLRVGEKAGLPLHHYPLAATTAAYDAVEHGAVGKVLIDISRPV
jgi:alcohol dehydrogenase-like protein